jgi:hypothetical protein
MYCYYHHEKIRTYVNGAKTHAKSMSCSSKYPNPGARFVTTVVLRPEDFQTGLITTALNVITDAIMAYTQ